MRVTPRRIPASAERVTIVPPAVTIQALVDDAFGDEALGVDEPRLVGPGFPCLLLGQHVGQQADRS